jgi:hypothetical protein
MTKLSQEQIEKLDDLIAYTIIPALQEDVCIPNMENMDEEHPCFDDTYEDRSNVLFVEAKNYLKNNL